mgnify:CR=1 FL=1
MREEFQKQLELLNEELKVMGGLIESAIANAVKALDGDENAIEKAHKYEKEINKKERDIESLCLKLLLTQQPVASDLRLISSALKMITDMERIGDQAEDIAEIAASVKTQQDIDVYKSKYIQQMAAATIDMVDKSVEAFVKNDVEMARDIAKCDDVVDELFVQVKNELIKAIKDNVKEDIVDILMVAKYFERIGDHAVNIGEWVEFSITGHHE